MQTILGRKKRNAKTIKLFSLLIKAFLYKERERSTFSIPKKDRNSY